MLPPLPGLAPGEVGSRPRVSFDSSLLGSVPNISTDFSVLTMSSSARRASLLSGRKASLTLLHTSGDRVHRICAASCTLQASSSPAHALLDILSRCCPASSTLKFPRTFAATLGCMVASRRPDDSEGIAARTLLAESAVIMERMLAPVSGLVAERRLAAEVGSLRTATMASRIVDPVPSVICARICAPLGDRLSRCAAAAAESVESIEAETVTGISAKNVRTSSSPIPLMMDAATAAGISFTIATI
mmetsp:Transcript_22896/g.27669  ORF Transcript_22896/g.27669 Transcript_22896/m.27669 type:complete len:246 (+) Transcript_22896:1410-2147(+)